MNAVAREKAELLEKLRVLLDVAGTATAWSVVAVSLAMLNVETLRSLVYRVERARADAFDEGTKRPEEARP